MQAVDLPMVAKLARAKIINLIYTNRTIFDKEINTADYQLAEQIYSRLYRAILYQEPFSISVSKSHTDIQWRIILTRLIEKINSNLIKAKIQISLGIINEHSKHYQVNFYLGFLVE